MGTTADKLNKVLETKAAIKDAIVAKGVTVTDTDTFASYPAKIAEISGGGAPATKYGVVVEDVLGVVDESGMLSQPTGRDLHINLNGVTKINEYCWYGKFIKNLSVKSVNLSTLENVYSYSFYSCFEECVNVEYVYAPSLVGVSSYGFSHAFYTIGSYAEKLKTAVFNRLELVDYYGCEYMFYNQSSLETFKCDSLKRLELSAFRYAFKGCSSLKGMWFPSLTTIATSSFGSSSSNYAFANCTALTEIHFRADMQATIEANSHYANKWGATNATIYFDLIGTITVNGVAYSRDEPNSVYEDDTKLYISWVDGSGNSVYTSASVEPTVGSVVYSDQGTTQVGTVEGVA